MVNLIEFFLAVVVAIAKNVVPRNANLPDSLTYFGKQVGVVGGKKVLGDVLRIQGYRKAGWFYNKNIRNIFPGKLPSAEAVGLHHVLSVGNANSGNTRFTRIKNSVLVGVGKYKALRLLPVSGIQHTRYQKNSQDAVFL